MTSIGVTMALAMLGADPAAGRPAAPETIGRTESLDVASKLAFSFEPSGGEFVAFDDSVDARWESLVQEVESLEPPEGGAITLPDEAPIDRFGIAGTEHVLYTVGFGSDFRDHALVRAGAAISYFIDDDISLDFEAAALYVTLDQTDDAFGLTGSLLLRWHFLHDDAHTWSVYGDAGAGLLVTTEEVPDQGSIFNFTPQLGGGVSFDLPELGGRMFTGVRWYHISNANTYDENPAIDFVFIYAGLAVPF